MKYVHKLISKDLSEEIDKMVIKINDFFGIKISGVDASKIISWKSKNYNMNLTSDKLIEILGGKVSGKVKKNK
jgi:hypothetical protein